MLRKLAMLAVIVAVVGAAALWVVTIPAMIPAGALAPYAPNLDNGNNVPCGWLRNVPCDAQPAG